MSDFETNAPRGPRPLADVIGRALAPACRRRGFATADLVAHWPDIVGPAYAETTAPERLSWPRRPQGLEDEDPEPGLLTVRCSGGVALRLTHELPIVVERINMFFGWRCVGRIRIVQLPVPRPERRRPPAAPAPTPEEARAAAAAAAGIDAPDLRGAVERLGRAVLAGRRRPITKS
jgi:hypothetical protein